MQIILKLIPDIIIFHLMKRRIDKRAYLYLIPAFAVVSVFSFAPFIKTFISSFFLINQKGTVTAFAGLANYRVLLDDAYFIKSIENTALFVILFLPLNTFLTLLSASLVKEKTKFNEWISLAYFLPLAFSLSLSSLIFKEMFKGTNSIINRIFGLDIAWLNDRMSAFAAIVLLSVFLDFALDHILLLSSFRKIDKSIKEASMMDGASSFQMYFKIELPLISPTLLMTMFIAFKDALLISAPIMTMTEGGPRRGTETVMYYYYLEAFKSSNRAAESTIATLMVLLSALILLLYYLAQRSARRRNG